jgi:hypothetical protein
MRALLLLAFLATTAHAETKQEAFATGMRIDASAVVEVHDFALTGAGPFHRALVGRFKQGELVINAVVLAWCEKTGCWYAHAWLGPGEVETLGVIDLAGKPMPFPTGKRHESERRLDANNAKWPALLVRTSTRKQETTTSRWGERVTGEHLRSELFVLSLALADTRSPELFQTLVEERWPTGGGMFVSFALDADGRIVATQQAGLENGSMCLPPKPVTVRYKLDKRRFQPVASNLEHKGCGSR